eukprot:gene1388-biopygen1238
MSQVSRSTRGLVEHHCTNRQNHTHLPQQWGGKQTKYNTLRKLNAMLQYEVTLEGTGTMLSSLRGAPPEIMRQPGEATRERTTKERMGSTTKTRRGKIEDGEIPHDDPTEPLKGPRTKTAVPKTEPEKLDFTTCLTLFRHFTNLTMLKSEDGKTAVSMKQRGTRCKGQTLQKHKKAIKTGMHHLYPYICEKVPPDIKGAKKFCKQESSRVLKPEYKTLQHTGPIDEHTRKTRLPNEQPETLREILDDWRSAGVTEKEIRNRFSLHPLTRDLATQGRDEEQEEGEKVTEEGRRAARDSRWSMEADEKKEQATIHLAQPGRPDYPVRYHATRQYAIDPNDPTTQNHWTMPPEILRALQEAFGLSTEVFASPLNVHQDTTRYYSKYERNRIFGSWGSAWEAKWGAMGAFQFNPECTLEDLKKALSHAIAATDTDLPFGVGVYPTQVAKAKGVYVQPGHPLGGCMDHEMCNMRTARADAQAAVIAKDMRNSRKGGCHIYAYSGNRTETDRKPRVIPDWILTRGQCRRDGKDNPTQEDGPDTVPSFVDMVMLEGTQGLKEGESPTQAEALDKVKMIHLVELT